ncbi:MAG: hypothetical protein AAGF11_16970 [Myxococcota bacterium]
MKITTTFALGALCTLCLLVPGCDSSKKDAKPSDGPATAKASDAKATAKAGDAKAAEAKAAEAKAAEAKAAEAKADGAEAAAEAAAEPPPKIGVAECDEYITTMSTCYASGKIPDADRDAHRMGFDASVKSWADSAKAHPEDQSHLVPGCKAALAAARKQYPSCFSAR